LGQDFHERQKEEIRECEGRHQTSEGVQEKACQEAERKVVLTGEIGAVRARRMAGGRCLSHPVHAPSRTEPMRHEKSQSPRSADMAEEQLDGQADGLEYEEITSDEVDSVVEQLERLMETVQSENIKSYLEDAISNIFFLVYEDDDSAEAA
jgi:hypothetical protein